MEIWIACGTKKELKKEFPFIRDFAIIDIKEIANVLGYDSSLGLESHSYFVLSAEVQKRLVSINSSKRFYRVLYLVEEHNEQLPQDLLSFSVESLLTYEKIFVLRKGEFELQLSLQDFVTN